MSRKLCTAAFFLVGCVVLFNSLTNGQDAKKPKGRLPPYYGDIVTPDQREKIYSIQSAFDAQREKLETQLAALKEKEDKEIESVLTPQQKGKLKIAQDEAAAKRKKKADDKKTAADGEDTGDKAAAKTTAPADAKKPATEKKTK